MTEVHDGHAGDELVTRLMQLASIYSIKEYPLIRPFTCDSFTLGEFVYVSTSSGKSKKSTTDDDVGNGTSTGRLFARGNIIEISPPRYPGRIKVQYGDGSTYHVAPSRLTPQLFQSSINTKPGIIVTAKTDHYRRLAKTQINPSDFVLEIGCDLGITVSWIAEIVGPSNVIGVDKSPDSIQVAKKTYPHCQYVELDIFQSREELLALAASCTKVLIDINGNRLLGAVLDALQLVLEGCPKVEIIIVKSVEMHGAFLNLHNSN